ncbi:hypothetical protein A3J17_00515 [Candidatus Curtissbacteria bacterium RIFCSPLOWO2_02_FULL_40_11]|uniref:Uncharacterized protein n=1 Tax=Candidatus Curtissbacteria bacterium RIFCSPHIGHO2_02_FULL_40_16b TaxID=1797714 RepID=A0A1F5G7Z5_9BACT|nr:MAG: hypothetical protein A3D04_03285 [Candidatus Curtissbacteria bacterium RIFCSPHIGHO2_02_FULL_40_16b]OGE01541.1 MAG: hypothetical protein A3J17_00515 [Candidatus Curtissbacteria bacterium RIFCSPLOWO2_02_FULL_40_11]
MANEERAIVPSGADETALARPESAHLAWPEQGRDISVRISRRPLDVFTGRKYREWRNSFNQAEKQAIEEFERDLAEKGLVGDHELLAPANVQRGVWAQAQGAFEMHGSGFLLFSTMSGEGKYESDSRTASSIQFAWSPNGQDILITEIPVDKMVLRTDPEVETPRVSFVFNRPEFIDVVNLGIVGSNVRLRVKGYSFVNGYLRGKNLLNANFTFAKQEDLKGLPVPNSAP